MSVSRATPPQDEEISGLLALLGLPEVEEPHHAVADNALAKHTRW